MQITAGCLNSSELLAGRLATKNMMKMCARTAVVVVMSASLRIWCYGALAGIPIPTLLWPLAPGEVEDALDD